MMRAGLGGCRDETERQGRCGACTPIHQNMQENISQISEKADNFQTHSQALIFSLITERASEEDALLQSVRF